MLWYYLRITIAFAFPVFYRRMQMKNSAVAREEGPMFFAMNHPNAFMDPISFSELLFYPRTRYMARGDAFKKGFAKWVLESMGVVPIFRLRDGGFGNIKKNLDSFEKVYRLLDKNQKIMVFGEGVCVQERRLRPIQKGTAKMAFAYLERGGLDNLKIIPVGLTYSTPSKPRGDFYAQVGEPILVKDHYEDYKGQPAQAIIKLTALIQEKLALLVPSLHHKANDQLIEQLQPIYKKQFIEEHNLNFNDLADQQKYWEFIIARLNVLTEENAGRMIDFRISVNEYSKQLEQLKIEDEAVYAEEKKQNSTGVFNILSLAFGFPFYFVGQFLNVAPYLVGKKIAAEKVKAVEFYSSILFGIAALTAKLFFMLELIIVWLLCQDVRCLLVYTLIKVSCGIFALHYLPFQKKIIASFRLKCIKMADSSLYNTLLKKRQDILTFLNEN